MSNVYGIEGKATELFLSPSAKVPAYAILMQERRPEPWYVANTDGTWTEDLDLKAERDPNN